MTESRSHDEHSGSISSDIGSMDVRLAAKDGNLEGIRAAVAANEPIDEQDEHGWTPLCWAAGAGQLAAVEYLLAQGADPFVEGSDRRTPYLIAIAAGHAATAKLLAEAEMQAGGDKQERSSELHLTRPYSRAYRASQLRAFSGWKELELVRPDPLPAHIEEEDLGPIKDDDLLFVHRSLRVTRSLFEDELLVFEGNADGWREFCEDELEFKPMNDFDWIDIGKNA